MANFIVGPDGQIYPAYDPRALPTLGQPNMPPPSGAGAMDDFYTGPGANTGFTLGQDVSGQLPQLAGRYTPLKAPGTGFQMGDGSGPDFQGQTYGRPVGPNQPLRLTGNDPAGFQAAAAEAEPALGEAADAMAPTLASKGLGLVGKAAGKLALPAALFSMMQDVPRAEAAAPPVNPNDPFTMQAIESMSGGANPNWSPAVNGLMHMMGAPGMAATQTAKDVGGAAGDLWDWATIPEKDRPRVADAAAAQGISPVEAWAQMREAQGGKDTTGETHSYDTGITVPDRPDVPQLAPPASADTSAMQKWLAMAEPKGPNAGHQKQVMYANLLGGLAKGLSASAGTLRPMDTLAKIVGGAAGGTAEGQLENEAENQKYAEAEQHYAQMMAGQSINLAQMGADQKNAVANVAFKNAMLKHQDALEGIAQGSPKFMGMKGGTALYQITGPDGRVMLKTYDTGNIGRQGMAKAFANMSAEGSGGHGGDVVRDLMAADLQPMDDPFGYMMMTASELQNKGVLSNVLGEKQYQAIDTAARNEVMTMPGDEKMKGQMYKQKLIGNAAGLLMNDRNLLGSAAPYSIFARGLYPYLNKPQGQ